MAKEDFTIDIEKHAGRYGVSAVCTEDHSRYMWIWPAWFTMEQATKLAEWENSKTPVKTWYEARLRLFAEGLLTDLRDMINLHQLSVMRIRPDWEGVETEIAEAIEKFKPFKSELEKLIAFSEGRMTVFNTGFCWKYATGSSVRFITEHLGRQGEANNVYGTQYSMGDRALSPAAGYLTKAQFADAVAEFLACRFKGPVV